MTEQLQHAIEALQRLPAEAQNAIAERILEEIEEQEWDAIVSKPRVQARLRELGKQAREEEKVGETEEGGFDSVKVANSTGGPGRVIAFV